MTGRVRLLALAAVLLLCWSAVPAMACSSTAPPRLHEVVDGDGSQGPIEGVFEYRHVSWTPFLGFRGERSVSIVTRYWGRAPENTGLEIHGVNWLLWGSTCSDGSASVGTVGYGMVEADGPSFRSVELIAGEGDLNRVRLTLLEDRFGTPVETPVPITARAAAWFLVLWQPLLVLGLVIAGPVWLVRRGSKRRRNQHARSYLTLVS